MNVADELSQETTSISLWIHQHGSFKYCFENKMNICSDFLFWWHDFEMIHFHNSILTDLLLIYNS